METKDLRSDIVSELTGGQVVEFDIDPSTVDSIINIAVRMVKPWYEERVAETLTVSESGDYFYIDLSSFTYTVGHIIEVFPSSFPTTGIADFTKELLDLPASPVDLSSLDEVAQWELLKPMLRKLWEQDLTYKLTADNLLLHGRMPEDNKITVEYAKVVGELPDITDEKAIIWVQEYSFYRTQRMLGRVRGKYRGGMIEFETDATELVSEANDKMGELIESLKTLQFNFCVSR